MNEMDEVVEFNVETKKVKKREPGVVYLSTIPPFMTVKKIRELLSRYGEVGHIFLQPEKKGMKRKQSKHFTEGWVEFKDKRLAKKVAAFLNNTQIGGKRRSRLYDFIWNIKYLNRFKWYHLNERLAYERAVHEQRMRTEISQAKRETNFYKNAVEKNENLNKLRKKNLLTPISPFDVQQRPTDDEIRRRKQTSNTKTDSNANSGVDRELLKAVFGGDDQLCDL